MVQLIRLVSENETVADVSNYFNEAIAIPKGSQIAVESLKIDLNDIITINNDNNTFVIQVSALQPNFNVELTNGTYTQSEFVTELTRAMASSMTYCFSPNIGAGVQERNYTEWKPIIFDDKLVLQYATAQPDVGRNLGFKGDLGTRIVQIENPAVGGFYVNDGYQCDEVVGDYSYIMTEKIAVNGAVEWRLNVDLTSGGAVYDDLVLGFRDISEPIVPITTFADLKYSMRILEDGGNPRIYAYINGAIYGSLPALLTPISDITMRITLQEGNVKFWYSFTDNNPNNVANLYIQIPNNGVTTLSTEYTYGNNFLGYILFGSVNNRCYNVCLTTSPYQNTNSSGLSLISLNSEIQDIESHINYDNLGQPASGPTVHTIIMNDAVKKVLGFLLNQYTVTASVSQFLAESGLDLGYYTGEIIVELPTEFIKAYEGSQHRRRNIIRYIPADPLQLKATRSHTFTYPLYLDLQNKEDVKLNYFQCRLLDGDFKPIPISGNAGSCVVLLIIN